VYPIEERPWGKFEILAEGPGYKIKRIIIHPGKRFSLQYHKKRAEFWTVVQGKGKVSLGPGSNLSSLIVDPTSSNIIEVPVSYRHRAENIGEEDFIFIEIQTGEYLEEDDIIRLKDDFNRV
jgi:mannose-6-phosphate isomerase-like protein (cupin superfamily)